MEPTAPEAHFLAVLRGIKPTRLWHKLIQKQYRESNVSTLSDCAIRQLTVMQMQWSMKCSLTLYCNLQQCSISQFNLEFHYLDKAGNFDVEKRVEKHKNISNRRSNRRRYFKFIIQNYLLFEISLKNQIDVEISTVPAGEGFIFVIDQRYWDWLLSFELYLRFVSKL